MRNKLRVIVIGKEGLYSRQIFNAISGKHQIVGVVESGPRDPLMMEGLGRWLAGKRILPNRLWGGLGQRAKRLRCPFLYYEPGRDAQLEQLVAKLRPDVICVASMSQLLPKSITSHARLGAVGVHPSLLPKYRGPNPWFWQFHQVEHESGVTIHRIDENCDTGSILAQESFPLPMGMSFDELLSAAADVGARLVLKGFEAMERHEPGIQQDHLPCPVYARRVHRDEPLIDWSWPIQRVWHVLRGTQPWLDAVRLPPHIDKLSVGSFEQEGTCDEPPGVVCRDLSGFYVSHAEGKIRLVKRPVPITSPSQRQLGLSRA